MVMLVRRRMNQAAPRPLADDEDADDDLQFMHPAGWLARLAVEAVEDILIVRPAAQALTRARTLQSHPTPAQINRSLYPNPASTDTVPRKTSKMVIRAEAQSLDMLTALADDPPLHLRRYPPVPPPHDPHSTSNQHQLKLYVVRVPNSHDIILTPLKPQSCTVTAQDITSCLYYLRVQPVINHSSNRPNPTPRSGSFDDAARPSYPRGSISGSSTRSEQLAPGASASNHASLSTTTLGSLAELTSTDFEITFIRRDRVTGSQTTVGRIYSNGSGTLDSLPLVPNSFAAQMMAQEALRSKKGRRDRKRLNLEIWTPGYQKFLCRPQPRPRPGQTAPDTAVSGAYLWPTPIPPPPPGEEDLSNRPPPPPKDTPKKAMMMNPAMDRITYQSRFTEIYSPDTPTTPRPSFPNSDDEDSTDADDGIFRRTLNLEGEGFWKSTGKRLSAFGAAAAAAHRRRKSHDQSPHRAPLPQQIKPKHDINEETRAAMEQMGLCSSADSSSASTPSAQPDKETKGKGYVFDAPLHGSGTCEFETNSVGRKIRLRLHPPHTMAGSPFGNTSVVKTDPLLLCTISFQPPDTNSSSTGTETQSSHARAALKLNKLGGKFKAKLHRENSWTEHVEQEAGSGSRSKLGSLLVEGEGMDVLDLVVVSSMGVFWKRYCEWAEDLREGGL
ncbi:hypothetical protein Dda_2635 [Drechslerella dactyloides]|uniref:Uncharacterized protein n=1 Tax=Drechslerella dactyloides TaxID=74499 RepID=A0AAD6NJK5_DREDA|nr:hypothetical protein Dda_2635 [Drechslerella dactyloides]